MIDVVPARFKNIDGSCHVVSNRGYLSVKLLAYNPESEEIDFSHKSDFIISPQNIDVLLGINAHDPSSLDPDGEVCFYEAADDPATRILRIQAVGNEFIWGHSLLQDEQLHDQRQIKLKKGQLITIQRMAEYALPGLYGWHAIYNP